MPLSLSEVTAEKEQLKNDPAFPKNIAVGLTWTEDGDWALAIRINTIVTDNADEVAAQIRQLLTTKYRSPFEIGIGTIELQ